MSHWDRSFGGRGVYAIRVESDSDEIFISLGGAPQYCGSVSLRKPTATVELNQVSLHYPDVKGKGRSEDRPCLFPVLHIEPVWNTSTKILRRSRIVPEWGCSSSGRAPPLQGGGRGFKSPQLHQRSVLSTTLKSSKTNQVR